MVVGPHSVPVQPVIVLEVGDGAHPQLVGQSRPVGAPQVSHTVRGGFPPDTMDDSVSLKTFNAVFLSFSFIETPRRRSHQLLPLMNKKPHNHSFPLIEELVNLFRPDAAKLVQEWHGMQRWFQIPWRKKASIRTQVSHRRLV